MRDSGQTEAATALIGLYLRTNQAAKGVAVAEKLVKQRPTSAEFFNLLGMCKGQTGDLTGARSAFETAIKLNDAFVLPKLNLARVEIASKSYDAAAARLAAILKVDDKNTEAMLEMAALSERRGQAAETQRWLEKATDVSGLKDIRAGLALSEFHLRNGRPGPALEAAKKVAGRAPDDLSMLMAYARAQLANRDNTGAKSTLASATRVAEYTPATQVQIALLQIAASNLPGATYSLEKALSTEPDFLPARALVADIQLRQSEFDKADKTAREIVSKNPKRAIGYSLLGDIAVAQGQTSAALEAYGRAYQLEPTTETFLRLFQATARAGKPAAPLAEQWMKNHPKDSQAQKVLADSYARAGNLQLAKAAYEHLLKISPDNGEGLNNLANVLVRLKDPAAVKVAEQAVAKSPGNASAIDTLGWALFMNGQPDQALQFLRDARLREPSNPTIRYHLATVLAKTGRSNEAREEVETALKSGRNFENAAEAGALLKSLK